MYRTTESSRKARRVVLNTDMNELLHQDIKGLTLKSNELLETLPETVSVGICSSWSDADGSQWYHHDPLFPVTGRLSNVLDEYIILPKVLGEGHYGCVRKCVHRSSRFSYACKSIDKSRISRLDRLDQLRREVRLLSQIDHDGIIRIVDCHEDADHVHIITEKYTGGELYHEILENATDNGCLSEHRAAGIVGSLLESVAYLHDNDIVHRDIKPENILFESEDADAIRLIDFGLSIEHAEGEPPMSDPVGSVYYMSPELLSGRYDRSTDLWSVGTILYILIGGRPPFGGESSEDIFEAIMGGRFAFPSRQWADKSDECKDLIRRLLRRNPRKRLTAREALMHPWIRNCGSTQERTTIRRRHEIIRCLRKPFVV